MLEFLTWLDRYMGISADAEIEDIKAAYRRLSKQYHPDTTSLPIEIAAQKFIQLKVELLNLRRNNVCCHSESRNSWEYSPSPIRMLGLSWVKGNWWHPSMPCCKCILQCFVKWLSSELGECGSLILTFQTLNIYLPLLASNVDNCCGIQITLESP